MNPLLLLLTHSKNALPSELLGQLKLSEEEIARYWDVGSKELYELENLFTISARYSRLYCDLNRAPDHHVTPEDRQGMIMETTYWDKEIYHEPLSEDEMSKRLAEHEGFFKEVEDTIAKQDIRFLISGHTMGHLYLGTTPQPKQPDICLSNNHFTTCDAKTTLILKELFEAKGYKVGINKPFKGGYALNYLCHRDRLPGLQIEFNIKLIGDPMTHELEPEALQKHRQNLQEILDDFWQKISA